MKALIVTFLILTGLTATSSGKPINDIYSANIPILHDEANVNDIPFNTWEVAVDVILDGETVQLAEEPYVDDIPFNTHEIACRYLLKKMMEETGDINVNDIPFNTNDFVCRYMMAQIIAEYRNEKNVRDLPPASAYIICNYENGIPDCYSVQTMIPRKSMIRTKKIVTSGYTINPVIIEMPKIELNDDDINLEFNLIPSSSL